MSPVRERDTPSSRRRLCAHPFAALALLQTASGVAETVKGKGEGNSCLRARRRVLSRAANSRKDARPRHQHRRFIQVVSSVERREGVVNSTSQVRWRRAPPAAPMGDAMLGQHRHLVPAVSSARAGAASAPTARLRSLRTPPPRRLVTQCSVSTAASSQLSRPLGLERRARRLHGFAPFALHRLADW